MPFVFRSFITTKKWKDERGNNTWNTPAHEEMCERAFFLHFILCYLFGVIRFWCYIHITIIHIAAAAVATANRRHTRQSPYYLYTCHIQKSVWQRWFHFDVWRFAFTVQTNTLSLQREQKKHLQFFFETNFFRSAFVPSLLFHFIINECLIKKAIKSVIKFIAFHKRNHAIKPIGDMERIMFT